jgi:hypothetical protein
LRELQYGGLLWIDALCINQSDIEEKQHQVALMGRIFESAENVLVGLDGANTDFDKAKVDHELVKTVLKQLGNDVHIHNMSSLTGRPLRFAKDCDAVRALCRVSDSTWFERVWVVQEVCLATTSYVLFAGGLLPWTTFRKAFDRLHAHRSGVCCSSIVTSLDPEVQMAFHRVRRENKTFDVAEALTLYVLLIQVYMHLASIEHTKAALVEGQHILEAMLCFQHLGAKLRVDKFNGYRCLHRGAHKGDPMPPPDYRKSSEQGFEQLTVWIIGSCGSLLPLTLGLQDGGGGTMLPSWVLDLSANPPIDHNYWRARINLYKAFPCLLGNGLNVMYEPGPVGNLTLQGVVVDRVSSVARSSCGSPNPTSHIQLLDEWCLFATGQPISELAVESFECESYCMTMLAGWVRGSAENLLRKPIAADLAQWRQDVRSMGGSPNKTNGYGPTMSSHLTAVLGQVLFWTETGSLGLGPPSLERGDTLWLFTGGKTTFATRQKAGGRKPLDRHPCLGSGHILVGPCYHHKLMEGLSGVADTLNQPGICVLSWSRSRIDPQDCSMLRSARTASVCTHRRFLGGQDELTAS